MAASRASQDGQGHANPAVACTTAPSGALRRSRLYAVFFSNKSRKQWHPRGETSRRRGIMVTMAGLLSALSDRVDVLYQRYMLGRKSMAHSRVGRQIPLDPARGKPLKDERTGRPYVSNFIRSSRYTVYDFVPRQLFFQFSKLANFYFLLIGIMQMIPGLSTTGTYTTIAPLIIFVSISMGKEGYDDYRRHVLDKSENKSTCLVLDIASVGSGSKKQRGSRRWTLSGVFGRRAAERPPVPEMQGPVEKEGKKAVASVTEIQESVGWSRMAWEDVRVGDVVRLRRDEHVPADMVLLHATGPNGVAYIDTMALDGETNLKGKQASSLLARHCGSVAGLASCKATVVTEDPNLDLYNFEGRLTVDGETMPLTSNQVVYRGSTLRNTKEALGLVINTGEECKIRMNATKNVSAKAPEMQSLANRIVLLLVIFVVLLSFGCSLGYGLWHATYEHRAWYLRNARVPYKHIIIGFIIQFNTLIPLSLYVSLEIIKLGQLFLLQDVEMYDTASDTPMTANTTTILENLGQVRYVFSDKTGTLTENLMRFRKMSVAGIACLHDVDAKRGRDGGEKANKMQPESKTEQVMDMVRDRPDTEFSRKVRHFLLCMALCHTCLPETDDNGVVRFQAASPDELALVEAAKELGYLLVERTAQTMKLQMGAKTEEYEVLDVIEFSSKRKRMSIVMRMPDGEICILTKGADSVVLPRLRQSHLAMEKASAVLRRAGLRKSMEQDWAMRRRSTQSILLDRPYIKSAVIRGGDSLTTEMDSWLTRRDTTDVVMPVVDGSIDESLATDEAAIFERCFQHMDDFASEGLRTLVFASKFLDEDEYDKWRSVYHEATTSLEHRQERIEAAAELIEKDLELAGATAIEDKLQQGVADTIDKLGRANIKVWMLTGDKRETAITIAHSARICKPFSEMYVLDAVEGDVEAKMASTMTDVARGLVPHSVMVIDGHTLGVVDQDPRLRGLFVELASRVDSVICCRASPSQKASLVECIRHSVPGAVTLAIGDGANDVAMIQASHVGIGISGREGRQAARIADYSIAQFRFLQRLLLVHGRWNYIRTAKYVLATFWKEMVFYLVQAQYQRHNGYTGTSLFEPASLSVFNTLFTSLPVILLGIFEKDLKAETLLAFPELYTFGQKNKGFSFFKCLAWMAMAAVESAMAFHAIYLVYRNSVSTVDTSLYAVGSLAFTVCVVFINVKMLVLELHNRTYVSFLGLFISVSGWFVWNLFLGAVYKRQPGPYVVRNAFRKEFGLTAVWWLTGTATLAALVVFEMLFKDLRRFYWPTDQDLMQEIERHWERRPGDDAVPCLSLA